MIDEAAEDFENAHTLGAGAAYFAMGLDSFNAGREAAAGNYGSAAVGLATAYLDVVSIDCPPLAIALGLDNLAALVASQTILDNADTESRDATFCMCSKVADEMKKVEKSLNGVMNGIQKMQQAYLERNRGSS